MPDERVVDPVPLSSSPPIHRAPNKFFDSLTQQDRARSSLGGRNSASSSSIVGMVRADSWQHLVAQKDGSVAPEVELQFALSDIRTYAHNGYVVRGKYS